MKKLWALVVLSMFAIAGPAFAADNPQQQRMKDCNAKAADKKGDERKQFMSSCLSNDKKAADNRMGACNTKSKGMKGDDRKKFMSECMKGA